MSRTTDERVNVAGAPATRTGSVAGLRAAAVLAVLGGIAGGVAATAGIATGIATGTAILLVLVAALCAALWSHRHPEVRAVRRRHAAVGASMLLLSAAATAADVWVVTGGLLGAALTFLWLASTPTGAGR